MTYLQFQEVFSDIGKAWDTEVRNGPAAQQAIREIKHKLSISSGLITSKERKEVIEELIDVSTQLMQPKEEIPGSSDYEDTECKVATSISKRKRLKRSTSSESLSNCTLLPTALTPSNLFQTMPPSSRLPHLAGHHRPGRREALPLRVLSAPLPAPLLPLRRLSPALHLGAPLRPSRHRQDLPGPRSGQRKPYFLSLLPFLTPRPLSPRAQPVGLPLQVVRRGRASSPRSVPVRAQPRAEPSLLRRTRRVLARSRPDRRPWSPQTPQRAAHPAQRAAEGRARDRDRGDQSDRGYRPRGSEKVRENDRGAAADGGGERTDGGSDAARRGVRDGR